MSILQPREAERLADLTARFQHRLFTAMTAKVTKANGRTVNVEILQRYPGESTLKITDVPVVHVGSAEMAVMVGVAVGDEGLVIFHKLDPSDAWRLNDVVDVRNLREHGTYAEFLPRRAALDTEAEWPDAGEITVGKPDGSIQLKVTASSITVKAPHVNLVSDSPGDAPALASEVDSMMSSLKTTLVAAFNAVGAAMAANGALGAAQISSNFNPTTVASDKVSLE